MRKLKNTKDLMLFSGNKQPFFQKKGDAASVQPKSDQFFKASADHSVPGIQKEDDEYTAANPNPHEPVIDWHAMNQPYYNRGLSGMDFRDYSLVHWRWNRTYSLARSFRLSNSLAQLAANTLTPMFIDAGLSYDNPTIWDQMDRQLNTSSKIVSPTVLTFDLSNFGATVDSPLRRLFGGKPRNPYRR